MIYIGTVFIINILLIITVITQRTNTACRNPDVLGLRWFGNDADGISLLDAVAIIIVLLWLVITVVLTYKMLDSCLVELDTVFYKIFLTAPTVLITGLVNKTSITRGGGLIWLK